MEGYDVLRVLALIVVWGIPAVLVLGLVAFIILAPAFAFGGLATKLYEATFARLTRKQRREASPAIGDILAAAGITFAEETEADRAVATKAFMRQTVTDIDKLMAKAGIKLDAETAPSNCWEMLRCPPGKREGCPVYSRRETPCWVAVGIGKAGELKEVCVNRVLLDLKALPSQS